MTNVVWGPGYGSAQPPSPQMGQDPFAEAERDTRAMVAAAWWPSAPPQQRQHAIGGRMLVLPDGTWWLFGAWARWYRLHPSDGQWYLCPPPRTPAVRIAARPAQNAGQVPALPPHVVPAGPDFSFDPPSGLPFVGHGFATDLTAQVRATVESAAALPAPEYPHWWSQFTQETPSTVAVAWGVMLWCASAPAFDARLDAQMLDLWKPYRAKPLPDVDGPRWLTPPALETLVGLYSERLRASRVDAAVVVLRTMWAVASALRDDPRFQIRADALLAILGSTLSNPTVDYGALPYGDQALVQQWLTRCPPNLVPALRNESSPGDNFRHAFYTLSEAIADLSGDPADPAYVEPRLVAAALLAADLDVVRKDMAGSIVPWLDPEIRYTVQAVSEQKGHPLRRLWPIDMRLPEPLRSAAGSGPGAETLLAAMYEVDLAWCRLGGMPARPRGFPVPTAIIAGIIGRNRARATAATPTHTPPPNPAPPQASPFGMQSQPGLAPGAFPQPQGMSAEPDRPFVQPPAQPGWENAPGPAGQMHNQMPGQMPHAGQQAAFAPPDPALGGQVPAEEDKDEGNVAPPYTELGFQRPGAAPPMPNAVPNPMANAVPNPMHSPQGPPGPMPDQGAAAQQGAAAAFGMPAAQPPSPYGTPEQSPSPYGVPDQPQPSYPAPDQGPQNPYAAPGQAQPSYNPPEPQPGGLSPEEEKQDDVFAPPYTQLGYQRPGAGPPAQGLPPGAGVPGAPGPQAMPGGPPPADPNQQPLQQPQPQQQPPPQPHQAPAAFDPYATRVEDPAGAPQGAAMMQPGQPVPPAPQGGPPGTRVLGPDDLGGDAASGGPPGPGTQVMSETMVGGFDFLDDTPSPERPVHEIPPPEDRSQRQTLERFGIGFVSGEHDAGALLDELHAQVVEWNAPAGAGAEETRVDGAPSSIRAGVPGVLLVGDPHSGQRRLARMIALTLADAGLGDGAIRAHDAEDVRDAPAERMSQVLAQPGPAILFERLDVAVTGALDPVAVTGAVRRARRDPVNTTPLIATCEPRAYKRLLQDHPKLVQVFRVHRMPDLTDLDNRMTLLHLLADERRVTIGAAALEFVRADLERLRGPGDLVNARLVETYLDQACQRHLERAGASRDRLVLTPDDLSGVAEGIEPALRPPGDIDGYLRQLDQLMGLEEVKATVRELAEEAGLAADRARYGVAADEGRHLIFTGPPGTGKTTVAGLIGGIYAALGLLESGHVVACRPVHLAGRDQVDTESRVASMVDQALGGVLLIQEAYRLDRSPDVVRELLRSMHERGARFMVICSSVGPEMEGFLAGNPAFRREFGRVVEFAGMSERDMVQLFQGYAERDLYMLDEELRVELLARFGRMREDPRFAYARTVRALFEQTVARQAARLAGVDVNAATVARLTDRDLPESALEQMLGDFRPGG
ncbi:AAA family ATPase [Actinomadura rubrisoli]|uniref:AAA family ATPase n=1 Tax=Actinomadura rubrisoli TaxID=2530368 RepID=A0A4R5B2R3_9ACTN|nr:AAA family ATPase [Actinomadura rubrisoli]TDD80021.1 AAA family ATPase [Actinomadura rubrisoli]